jgi:hypothetical protein
MRHLLVCIFCSKVFLLTLLKYGYGTLNALVYWIIEHEYPLILNIMLNKENTICNKKGN